MHANDGESPYGRSETTEVRSLVRPFWVPPGVEFEELPEGLQLALQEIFSPLYEELVLNAPTALERATGLSLCYTTWLELVDEYALAREMGPDLTQGELSEAMRGRIERHLRISGAKGKCTNILLQLRRVQARRSDPLGGSEAPRDEIGKCQRR